MTPSLFSKKVLGPLLLAPLFALMSAAAPRDALAQEYPTAPIRVLTGFPAGTAADVSLRIIAPRMSAQLGQQIVVDNRPGAGSSIAAAAAARAPKDGYTLLFGSTANLVNAALSANLSFDFFKDLAPISLMTSAPTVLLVSQETGVKSVAELVALAKAKPGALSFASSGINSTTHLTLEMFHTLAGIKTTHIPYQGSPQVINDMLAGRINGYFAPASVAMPFIRSGKLVALAVTDAKRAPLLPELPTMIEAGVPGYEAVLWFGLLAPAGTPNVVIERVSHAANDALKNDEVVKSLLAQSITALGSTPAQFKSYIESEKSRWAAVIAAAGLKKE
ncbi:MAG: extra-cytoplasmic solute receptor [Betaproteobacteria bacterium]|nr:extra-cytoplasmic solute receptor [Betaproteobacteria bacterium]